MSLAVRAYIGLGSNLGDRAANLLAARDRLAAEPGIDRPRLSRLYETEPVGPADQPWYVNAVLETAVELPALTLLRRLKALERTLGRRPGRRWGERLIDLDLLLYDDLHLATPELTLPHPRMWERRFVLVPLRDLAPELRGPAGRPLAELIAALGAGQALRAYAPTEPADAAR